MICIRPEDRGEDFTPLATKELLRRLTTSTDIGGLRKSAAVIGDRAIRGTLDLDEADKQTLEGYIASRIAHLKTANDGGERSEAKAQLLRLWRLSVPQLLDNVGHTNPFVGNVATESLRLMRDENVINSLITRVEASKDPRYRQHGVFTLGMMCEKRDPLVRDRKTLDDTSSKELADRLIVPFLDRLEATDPDPVMKRVIANARKFLKDPLDGRPRIVKKPPEKEASK